MAASVRVLVLASVFLFKPALAFWRLPCMSPIVVERADPILSPGGPSGHVHTIMGGNGFSFTMDYASTQSSSCSSCTVQGDFSNYWTPALYYQYQNGSFEDVKQIGGATVYYLQRPGNNETLTAFPEGLRMVAGDPWKRNATTDFAGQAISYACLDYNTPATSETPGFPTTNCPDGLRAQIFFPSCWDGINLDSPDHTSHMSYPATSYNYGACPVSHPVHLISLFYEVIWSVDNFASLWYGKTQPFVWAQGDSTGYGLHGDFLNGWDVSLLQSAVDRCTNDSGNVEDCPVFDLTPDDVANECSVPSMVDEPVSGVLETLPGCNLVQSGPNEAVSGCRDDGTSNVAAASTSSVLASSSQLSASENSLTLSSDSITVSASLFTSSSSILEAVSTSTASVTVSVTKIHSVTVISSKRSSSNSFGPSTSTKSKHFHAERSTELHGQHLYGDDLRWRKYERGQAQGYVW